MDDDRTDAIFAIQVIQFVNHCLDTFGPDRVFFGGDWPVCLLGSPVRGWVDALKQIISSRPTSEQRKLWSGNAVRFYGLKV